MTLKDVHNIIIPVFRVIAGNIKEFDSWVEEGHGRIGFRFKDINDREYENWFTPLNYHEVVEDFKRWKNDIHNYR